MPTLAELVMKIDLDQSTVDTIKTYKFHDYRPKQFKTEILWAKAEDGTKIPIAVFYNEFQIKQKLNGIIIKGYGMYGGVYESGFSLDAMIYAKQGFIVAWPLVRGGADLGQEWHNEGKLLNKKTPLRITLPVPSFCKKNTTSHLNEWQGKDLAQEA